jgi:hypothetical protein
VSAKARERAADLASKEMDKLKAHDIGGEEHHQRKRRLSKGQKSFRNCEAAKSRQNEDSCLLRFKKKNMSRVIYRPRLEPLKMFAHCRAETDKRGKSKLLLPRNSR